MARQSTKTPEERAQDEREKRARWLREGSRRTNAAVKAIKRLGNCANKSNYAYETSEVQAAFEAIREQLTASAALFSGEKQEDAGFVLPGADPSVLQPNQARSEAVKARLAGNDKAPASSQGDGGESPADRAKAAVAGGKK